MISPHAGLTSTVYRRLDRPWVRLCILSFLLAGLASTWFLRKASAEVTELAINVGQKLRALSDSALSTTALTINGEQAEVTSIRSTKSLDDLLRQFAALCQQPGANVQGGLESPTLLTPRESTDLMDLNVFSFRSSAQEAAMFCFAGSGHWRELASRARDFAKSGDVAELGEARYFYAQQLEGRSVGLLVRTPGPFNLRALMPEGDGDAPGIDIAAGVRPPGSRRVLSAAAASYGMSTYESKQPLAQAVASYASALERAGFDVRTLPQEGKIPASDAALRVATNADAVFVISARRDEDEPQALTVISAMRLGSVNHLRVE